MLGCLNFDSLCGAIVATVRTTVQAVVAVFNLLDPFKVVRATSRLQRHFVEMFAA